METFWKIILDVVGSAVLGGITVAIANGGYHQHWSFLVVWLVWFIFLTGGIVIVSFSDGGIDFF